MRNKILIVFLVSCAFTVGSFLQLIPHVPLITNVKINKVESNRGHSHENGHFHSHLEDESPNEEFESEESVHIYSHKHFPSDTEHSHSEENSHAPISNLAMSAIVLSDVVANSFQNRIFSDLFHFEPDHIKARLFAFSPFRPPIG